LRHHKTCHVSRAGHVLFPVKFVRHPMFPFFRLDPYDPSAKPHFW